VDLVQLTTSAEGENGGVIPSLPIGLHGIVLKYVIKHRNNFTFSFFT
jgi:hypothetical protein